MATISIGSIINLLVGSASKRNDKTKWSAWLVDQEGDKETAEVKSVSLEALTGLKMELKTPTREFTIEARPSSLKKTQVYLDDVLDPEANLVFDFKGSLTNPSRWGFDFRPVTFGEDEIRINTRFDP